MCLVFAPDLIPVGDLRQREHPSWCVPLGHSGCQLVLLWETASWSLPSTVRTGRGREGAQNSQHAGIRFSEDFIDGCYTFSEFFVSLFPSSFFVYIS